MACLRGKYSVECGIASWEGQWGFSEKAFAEFQTSKFSYKSRASAGIVSLNGPVSGLYDGFFNFKIPQGAPRRINEKGLHLTFTKSPNSSAYIVTGKGANRFGTFDVQGTLDGANLNVTKVYTS